MKRIAFISLLVSILFSCTKKPEAKFWFVNGGQDAASFRSGDVVRMINQCKNAVRYEWLLPDGRIVNDKEPEFTIPSDLCYTNFTVKLTAFSKNDKYSETAEESFSVEPQFGTVVFWKSASCGCGPITVSLFPTCPDTYTWSRTVTADFSSAPSINTPGAATMGAYVGGEHAYSATDGVKNWNGTFTITQNCNLNIQLN